MEPKHTYTTFEEYFKTIVPHLWLVKDWNNETIKIWLENAFEDARITIKDPKDTR